jgi:hypothetical protein
MSEEDQRAFDNILQRADKHSSISYLAPKQTSFEQLLLTMMVEIHKETENLKGEVAWKLKKWIRISLVNPKIQLRIAKTRCMLPNFPQIVPTHLTRCVHLRDVYEAQGHGAC